MVKIIDPLAGFSKGLHNVSLQIGASGSHFPLVSHLRRSKPGKKEKKRFREVCGETLVLRMKIKLGSHSIQKYVLYTTRDLSRTLVGLV